MSAESNKMTTLYHLTSPNNKTTCKDSGPLHLLWLYSYHTDLNGQDLLKAKIIFKRFSEINLNQPKQIDDQDW